MAEAVKTPPATATAKTRLTPTRPIRKPPAKQSIDPSLRALGITLVVIVAGGLALQLARPALTPRLDALPDLAELTRPSEPVPADVPPPAPEPESEPEEPIGPQLTYEQIESMLAPLSNGVLELIKDGRRELSDYKDMDSKQATRAERGRRFFQNWGNTWNNRLDALVKDTPPREECEVHPDHEATCLMLYEVTALLRQVPSVTSVRDGRDLFDQADQVVELFLNPPEEEEEDLDPDAVDEDSVADV